MKKSKWFWGFFFIAAAVVLVIGKLGILGDIGAWSLIFTVMFAATAIQSLFHRNVPGVLFSLAFLCIIYAEPLGITAITPWTVLGAALLGSIGISFFYHPKRSYSYHYSGTMEEFDEIETVEGNAMEFVTKFGSGIKYLNSDDFRSARIECSFGGMKVYFDNAVIRNGSAAVNLDVSFSGVELFVPKTWEVVDHANAVFGGVEEKNHNNASGDIKLVLAGDIKFAGVTIIYV